MKELFSLGELYPSDFLAAAEKPRCSKIEMKLILDNRGRMRLEKSAPLEAMYGKYWYRSGINITMTNEMKNIVDNILHTYEITEGNLWLDIACNDGTLLSFVPKNLIRVGIDPSDDTYKKEAEQHADLIIQDYFSFDAFKQTKYGDRKAKVITSIAMFYDLEHPKTFIQDIDKILEDQGLWVMQLSYTPLMLKQLAFDNICHEHIFYYSLFNLKSLLEEYGFQIIDCQLNDINGGSFRVFVMRKNSNVRLFSTQPYRDVSEMRIKSLLNYEATLLLDQSDTWKDFYIRLNALKEQTISFIINERSKGKSIWGYGASTKGNTLLQYFGLDCSLIDAIADRNPAKWGLRTVGTNIPIYSEEKMRAVQPDYLLILPWHFINEFMKREKEFLQKGGKFIVPCPKFEIID